MTNGMMKSPSRILFPRMSVWAMSHAWTSPTEDARSVEAPTMPMVLRMPARTRSEAARSA